MRDHYFIDEAIKLSQESVTMGGYPCGAIIVKDQEIVALGFSDGKNQHDATMHAEIDAIRKASAKLKSRSLADCILYTSMEPCVMCFSASFWAYIPRVVYACARSQVDVDYYMGHHDIEILNQRNYRRKIELIHHSESSEKALEIINQWESSKQHANTETKI